MDYKNIFADQSTIQINVMKIDGRRLTKSIMDQISMDFPFDQNYLFTGEKVFGYVAMDVVVSKNPIKIVPYWGVAQVEGKLVRFNADKIKKIASINLNTPLIHSSDESLVLQIFRRLRLQDKDIYKAKYINEYDQYDEYLINNDDTFKSILNDIAFDKLLFVIRNANSFTTELREHQIII